MRAPPRSWYGPRVACHSVFTNAECIAPSPECRMPLFFKICNLLVNSHNTHSSSPTFVDLELLCPSGLVLAPSLLRDPGAIVALNDENS